MIGQILCMLGFHRFKRTNHSYWFCRRPGCTAGKWVR